MRIFTNTALLLGLFLSLPVTYSYSLQAPEDQDTSGDGESSGSGLAEYEPVWVTDVFAMPTEQTTRTPIKITSHSPSTSVSQPLLTTYQQVFQKDVVMEEATTFNLKSTEKKTSVLKEGFTPTVVEDSTKKTNLIEGNTPMVSIRPTVSKVIDKNTSVSHMKTKPVQTTKTTDAINPELEAAAKSTTVFMTSGDRNFISSIFEDTIISNDRDKVGNPGMDSDFHFDNENKTRKVVPVNYPGIAQGASLGNDNLLEKKEVLAGVIAGGAVGLMFAIMLVALMVYRMKKKDEGSYALDEHRHPNAGYQKPQKQMEFLA